MDSVFPGSPGPDAMAPRIFQGASPADSLLFYEQK